MDAEDRPQDPSDGKEDGGDGMTRSYIMNEVFHIETNDTAVLDDLLDCLEVHLCNDVDKHNYEKANERIGAYIEMEKALDQYKMEKGEI